MNILKFLITSLALATTTAPALAQLAPVTPVSMDIFSRTTMQLYGRDPVTLTKAVNLNSSVGGGPGPSIDMTPGNFQPLHYLFRPSTPGLGYDYYLGAGTIFDAASSGGSLYTNTGKFEFSLGWETECRACYDPLTFEQFDAFPGGSISFDNNWFYEFTPRADGEFRLNYSLSAATILLLTQPSNRLIGDGAIRGSGSFTYALTAGQNFRLDVKSISGAAFDTRGGSNVNGFGFYLKDVFSYQIIDNRIPIPEPATWAMMIFGFGAVGGAARRRAKVRVAYS